MNYQTLQAVADWMKRTDLIALSYRRDGATLAMSVDAAAHIPEASFPPCRLVPVTAQEVGLFRFQRLGKSGSLEEGGQVKEGQVLGQIEAGRVKHEVKAPASGRIASLLAEDGAPVEFGQSLFFIQP